MARTMFEKALGIVPRDKLDEWARDFASNETPWQSDRKNLEATLVAKDPAGLRDELSEYLERTITGRLQVRR